MSNASVTRLPSSQSSELRELWNVEAEQALLGSLLVSNEMIERLPENFGPEHFYDQLHARIFTRIRERIDRGQGANATTLLTLFEGDKAIEEVGGTEYLRRLPEAAISFLHARDYAEEIYDHAIRRMLIEVAGDIAHAARDGASGRSPEDQVRDAEQRLYALGEQGRIGTGFKPFSQLAYEAVQQAADAARQGGVSGLSTGLVDLDKIIGGLKKTDLIIVAGRTSMGKSALAINVAFNVAERILREKSGNGGSERRSVAYYSLEMAGLQLINRILSTESEIRTEQIQRGMISQRELERFTDVCADLGELPLLVNDAGSMTIDQLCSSARRLRRTMGIEAIFVDYLQLVDSSFLTRREGRVQQVAEVSRRLKALAKELDVPVVALAQLSRALMERKSRVPQLSDLRESGSIEQDADIVLLIHRESYYLEREKPDISEKEAYQAWMDKKERAHNTAMIYVAKNRNGRTGQAEVRFDEAYTRFSNLDREELAPAGAGEFG